MAQSRKKQHEVERQEQVAQAVRYQRLQFSTLSPSRWPTDIAEMADRIAKEGERAVPNRDRNIVARNLPTGCLTRRDGSSVRPVYRDPANV